jgi:hypothetical protein
MNYWRTLVCLPLLAVAASAAPQAAVDRVPAIRPPWAVPADETGSVREQGGRVEGLSTRPWTAELGWRPGASAFADAVSHEAGLHVLSINFGSQPD